MQLKHPSITSSVFKLIGTYEFDLLLGTQEDGDQFSLRIELLQSAEHKTLFRRKAWRSELFRIQSSFPQENTGEPKHAPSDEMVLTGFSQPHFLWCDDFHASNRKVALERVAMDIGKLLEHITSAP